MLSKNAAVCSTARYIPHTRPQPVLVLPLYDAEEENIQLNRKAGFGRASRDSAAIKMSTDRQTDHPHQSAAGHTGNQLGSLAAEDESSQIKENTHHRQQDKHIDLEMWGWGWGVEEGGKMDD